MSEDNTDLERQIYENMLKNTENAGKSKKILMRGKDKLHQQIYLDPFAVSAVKIKKLSVQYNTNAECIHLNYQYVEDMAFDIERITGEKWG